MTVLEQILARKREELAVARGRLAPERLAEKARSHSEAPRGFRRALAAGPGVGVIAEIKRRSPSRGEIRADFDPTGIAQAYDRAGAAAISVLTDETFFGGSLGVLSAVRAATERPLLRKDFVVDTYQIDEARVAGADAVLLIVAALAPEALAALHSHARRLGLDVLVEVHDAAQMQVAAALGADLIGINNRDLRSFVTDLAVTERLAPLAPTGAVVVGESGIVSYQDVQRLAAAGVQAVLVGESLMRELDPGAALRRLRGFS